MTRDDYEFAKGIYERMFFMQVFKPEEMKQAYKCLFNAEPANVQQARARVAAYFRYNVQPVFTDETISVASQDWTHDENPTVVVDGDLVPNVEKEVDEMYGLDKLQENIKPKRKRINKKK